MQIHPVSSTTNAVLVRALAVLQTIDRHRLLVAGGQPLLRETKKIGQQPCPASCDIFREAYTHNASQAGLYAAAGCTHCFATSPHQVA